MFGATKHFHTYRWDFEARFFCTISPCSRGLQRLFCSSMEQKQGKTTLMIIAYGPTEYFHINRWDSFHFDLKTLKPFLPNLLSSCIFPLQL